MLQRVSRWAAFLILIGASAIACVVAYPSAVVALSRPATPADMHEIAVAVLQQTGPPLDSDEPNIMYPTVNGRELPSGDLKKVSHGHVVAMPAHLSSGVSPERFTADVGAFLISPFGDASGMVYTNCASLCGEGIRFVLRKQNGRWVVVSRTLEVIA